MGYVLGMQWIREHLGSVFQAGSKLYVSVVPGVAVLIGMLCREIQQDAHGTVIPASIRAH